MAPGILAWNFATSALLDVGRVRRLQYVALFDSTSLDAFLSSFSTSRRCSRNRSPSRLLVSPIYTPNANMADHSVVARDELHESEVSWALMFCFENASPENSCFVVDLLFYFGVPTSCCVSECDERG